MKKKLVFVGDTQSVNLEIIAKSHQKLKNKVKYILLGNKKEIINHLSKTKYKITLNEIFDLIKFHDFKKNELNIYNIDNISSYKYKNLLNQIDISNFLSSKLGFDLVTMPIDKSIFKKKIKFTGMTEHLGKINNKKTFMIMYGDKFSVIPLTTHINLKKVHNFVKKDLIFNFINSVISLIENRFYNLKVKKKVFLCFNPHCSENGTLGTEDQIIKTSLIKSKKIDGPIAADSAFNKLDKNTLFFSMYHDQALIPFKILNKKSFNLTLGLNYRRLSPSHGTAKDIIFKNIANNTSYLECMIF